MPSPTTCFVDQDGAPLTPMRCIASCRD
jgi:hypothetical protein